MHEIKKSGTTFNIDNFPWDDNGYKPKTQVTIGYDEGGFNLNFVSYETDIRATETEHNMEIYKDSCMEIFMKFAPSTDKNYINIEINPNGAAYCAVSECREISEKIEPRIIDTLNIKTKVYPDRWEIKYYISKEFIQRFIPSYVHGEGNVICGNFYKCGDLMKYPHWACFNYINWEHPDFHRPEFFTEFKLV